MLDVAGKTTLPVHNALSGFSIFDEAFLACSDGHCLFDQNSKLVSWSVPFEQFYHPIADKIKIGYDYRDFVRDLLEQHVLKNMKPVDDIDRWILHQMDLLNRPRGEYVQHLMDERIMLIKHVRLSNQFHLFAAFDITELRDKTIELAVNQNKFRTFAQLSSDWFWELDSELCYRYYSSHKKPVGVPSGQSLVGMNRLAHVGNSAIHNDQLLKHNESLKNHGTVDAVLSWQKKNADHAIAYESDKTVTGIIHIHVQAKPIYNQQGIFTGYIGYSKDVTESYGLAQKLEHRARHDDLTDLLNRSAFSDHLDTCLTNIIDGSEGTGKSLIYIDLDQFKLVNDSAGHLAGDTLLKEIAQILTTTFGRNAIISRLGGDEFGVIQGLTAEQARADGMRLIKSISEYKYKYAGRIFSIGASVGIVDINKQCRNSTELLSCANIACHSAKVSGRNQVQLYSRENPFHRKQNDELAIIKLLNDSLTNNGMQLFLQPLIPTRPGDQALKFEVLLRIQCNGKLIPPGDLIPVAEKYDRMQHIDLWVLENAITHLNTFLASGLNTAFSVNLSGNTLSDEYCMNRIAQIVQESRLTPGTLCFEITETAAIKGVDKAIKFIQHLKEYGCEFSLDDFGSGLSSFSYLRLLDVDYLKIDGSFVKKIQDDYASFAIVKSFNTLGHEMGMKTVAEFVENEAVAKQLSDIGIDFLQGYGMGKPNTVDYWLDQMVQPLKMTGT